MFCICSQISEITSRYMQKGRVIDFVDKKGALVKKVGFWPPPHSGMISSSPLVYVLHNFQQVLAIIVFYSPKMDNTK